MLFVAACSSSGNAGDGSPTAGATDHASPVPALTGAPVTLGVITDASGSSGSNTSMSETATRWVDYINGHGGIHGRPVKVIVKDSGNNAATALQDAKELVEQDKVVAIGDDTFVNSAYEKYVDGKHIPVISMGAGLTTFTYVEDANFFSPTVNAISVLWGLSKAAALLGKQKFGYLYCAEVTACAQSAPVIEGLVKSVNISMAYSAGFSASAPNYTAQCLAAKGAGTDALLAAGSIPAADQRVYDDCSRQGYQPLAVLALGAISPAVFNDSQIPLAVSISGVQPWFENQGPTFAAMHSTMDDYLQQKSTTPPLVTNHWVGLEMFKQAADAAAPGSAVTTADIYRGLYAMKDETLGGAVPPFTILAGKPTSAKCLYAYQSSKGKLSTLNDDKPICQTS
jgi:branched-chain amino acid transport system substrate-binding protein